MLTFTKEQAIIASEQFISGLARFAECFIEEGAGARILGVDNLNPPFEFFALDSESQAHADQAAFGRFEFTRAVALLYDFAANGFARSMEVVETVISDGMPYWEVFNHGGHFVDRMGQQLVGAKHLRIIDAVYKAASARAMIIGHDLYANNLIPLDHLAELAGVSVKTLRNAATQSGKATLKTTRDGSKTMVEPNDALEWLRARPGFKESRVGDKPSMERYTSVEQLGLHLASLCESAGIEPEKLGPKAGLAHDQAKELTKLVRNSTEGHNGLTASSLLRVANELGFDEPKAFTLAAIQTIAGNNAMLAAIAELN